MKSKVLEVKNKALLKAHRNEILKVGKVGERRSFSNNTRQFNKRERRNSRSLRMK